MAFSPKYEEICEHDGSQFANSEEEIPIMRLSARKGRNKHCILSWSTYLVIYSAAITTIMFGLVIVHITHTSLSEGSKGNIFAARFSYDLQYMSADHKYDYLWDDQDGPSTAGISLPDPEYGGEVSEAVISMFHQLGCISAFRKAIQGAKDGIDPGVDLHDNRHWPFCLDYMRKTILCWADDTIERQRRFTNGTLTGVVDGTKDLRRCGDNGKLIKMMKESGTPINMKPFP